MYATFRTSGLSTKPGITEDGMAGDRRPSDAKRWLIAGFLARLQNAARFRGNSSRPDSGAPLSRPAGVPLFAPLRAFVDGRPYLG
jgi:hypothetical protein